MDLEIEPATALYGIAAFLGAITVIYFGSSLIFDLSPVTKSLAFFASFVVFLSISMYLSGKKKTHSIISLGMTGISYLAFLSYTLGKFEVSEEGVFASLLLSSLLFVALGYLVNENKIDVDREHLKYIVSAIVLVGSLIIIVDVAGAQPTQSLELENSVTLQPEEEAVIGTLTVDNNFIFPREFSEPNFNSCIGESRFERGFYVDVNTDDMIPGSQERKYNMTVEMHRTESFNTSRTVEIERTNECPSDRGNTTLYIFERQDSGTIEYVD